MESKKEKIRGRNFTEFEKKLIYNIVRSEFLDIVENKRTDKVANSQKYDAWVRICQIYNAQAQTGPRTQKQLHALYDNLKKIARTNVQERHKLYTVGGDRYVPRGSSILDERSNSHDDHQYYAVGGDTHLPRSSAVLDESLVVLKPHPLESLKISDDSNSSYQMGFVSDLQPKIEPISRTSAANVAPIASDTEPTPLQSQSNDCIDINDDSDTEARVVGFSRSCESAAPALEDPLYTSEDEAKPSVTLATNPRSSTKKRKRRVGSAPTQAKRCADILSSRMVRRKNAKDRRDEEIHERRKKIMKIEEAMKLRELEIMNQRAEMDLKLKEFDLKLKEKQLEALELDIRLKRNLAQDLDS